RLEVAAADLGLAVGDPVSGLAFSQTGGRVYWDRAGVINRSPAAARSFDSLEGWETAEKTKPKSKLPQAIQEIFKVAADKRDDTQRAALRNHFVRYVYKKTREHFEPLDARLEGLRKSRTDLDRAVPVTMVMRESEKPRETFVLMRGDFRSKGDKV